MTLSWFDRIFSLSDARKSCVLKIFLLRSIKAYLCPNIIEFDSVDFRERRPEEVISFFWCSVYLYVGHRRLSDCLQDMSVLGLSIQFQSNLKTEDLHLHVCDWVSKGNPAYWIAIKADTEMCRVRRPVPIMYTNIQTSKDISVYYTRWSPKKRNSRFFRTLQKNLSANDVPARIVNPC